MEILKIRNLSFSYPSKEEKALSNLSFSVHAGEFLLRTVRLWKNHSFEIAEKGAVAQWHKRGRNLL